MTIKIGSESSAWGVFLPKLVTVLNQLQTGQWLNIQKSDSASDWIQFASQGKDGYRVETKSNWYRNDDEQLSPEQIQVLIDLGWSAPTGDGEASNPDSDPEGSPNFFFQLPVKLSLKTLDSLVTKTFDEVLGVSSPTELCYEAYESDGNSLLLPQLGLKVAVNCNDENPKLAGVLLDVLREITRNHELACDDEGDIGPIGFRDIRTYVRVVECGQYIRFYAPLQMDILETPAFFRKINELNTVNGFMHLCIMPNKCLMAASDILATPLVTRHIAQALAHFMQLANEFSTELEAEFGGNDASKQELLLH